MKKKEKIFELHNLIFIIIITTTIIIGYTLSRYESKIEGRGTTTIAVMADTVSTNIEVPLEGYPGSESIIAPITLANKENGKVCEVSQKYTIEIEKQDAENIPLNYSLYKDEYCTEIIETDENGKYTSEDFTFKPGIEESKTYYLKIDWPEDQKSELYAFEIEYFNIKVVSTQID